MKRALFILHTSPPVHGAAKVGDCIKSSRIINDFFSTRFVKINSSSSLDDIARINLKKILRNANLFLEVLWSLVFFRPSIIYFTVSVSGIAFYRDFCISILIKLYSLITSSNVFYHYHMKGVEEFCFNSVFKTKLVSFFLRDVNVILLSPELEKEFSVFSGIKNIYFLPNGVADGFSSSAEFVSYLGDKFSRRCRKVNVLFLSNMLRDKGFMDVLEFANRYKNVIDVDLNFFFAGGWGSDDIKKEFFDYVEHNKLEELVFYKGFVSGSVKDELLKNSHLLFFPTKNEAFGLVVPEAFSYGIPVVTSSQGSLPFIVSPSSGLIVDDISKLDLFDVINEFVNVETSLDCRGRYLELFEQSQFEDKLLEILNGIFK